MHNIHNAPCIYLYCCTLDMGVIKQCRLAIQHIDIIASKAS